MSQIPAPTGSLWAKPPVHHNAPAGTSIAAASKVAPKAETLRAQVLAFIASREQGATDEEGMTGCGLAPNTYRPRRWELARAGLIVDSGQRRVTLSGSKAAVWIVKGKP